MDLGMVDASFRAADALMAVPLGVLIPTVGWLIKTIMRFEKQLAELQVRVDHGVSAGNRRDQISDEMSKSVHQMSRNVVRIGEHMKVELEQ